MDVPGSSNAKAAEFRVLAARRFYKPCLRAKLGFDSERLVIANWRSPSDHCARFR
jgi:hypothetical protein